MTMRYGLSGSSRSVELRERLVGRVGVDGEHLLGVAAAGEGRVG